jgi:hypothetical protein
VKKKAALIVAATVAVLGIASAVYLTASNPHPASRAEQATHEPGQIQAPPHPPRTKPLERVVVSK